MEHSSLVCRAIYDPQKSFMILPTVFFRLLQEVQKQYQGQLQCRFRLSSRKQGSRERRNHRYFESNRPPTGSHAQAS
jgi:hypothetical protein